VNDESKRVQRPALAAIVAALALGAGSGMALPVGLRGEPTDVRRRSAGRCGGYPVPPSTPREPTPAEVAAHERNARRAAKRAEQMRRAAKGGADPCPVHTDGVDGLNCGVCIRASAERAAKGGA
jgi:hypothetical protein